MTDLRKAAETDNIVEQAIQGHSSTRDAIRWAITQEREACAKVCDEALLQLNETANQIEESEYMEKCVIQGAMTQSVKLGKAIRARSEK